MEENFKLYSQYYDLLYQDKDYVAEADYVANLIETYKAGAKKILELGAGTGKHAFLLANKGYKTIGLERSADMVAIANNEKNANVVFKVADITDFKLDETFDVATSLFHVISYLTENKHLIQTFNNVNTHLNQGGIFIFDVWHSPAVYHQVPEKRNKKLVNDKIEVSRDATPISITDQNVVEVDYAITITNLADHSTSHFFEKHPMRHFSKPEIELLAYATGFELIHAEEFLSAAPASTQTWGVCYVLKKNN